MKCSECGGPLTTEHAAVRRYVIGGLPHVELHGIEVTRCETCGKESIAIPRIGQLHRVIAHTFVTQHRMLAPVEIRFLRAHIGLSGVDFAQRMGVSRETVSRWETGKREMGAVADRLLRLLVVTHEPTDNYAIDDLLSELNDKPAPKKLTSIAVQNREKGWAQREHLGLARA
jgi:putative transcriptional regulator